MDRRQDGASSRPCFNPRDCPLSRVPSCIEGMLGARPTHAISISPLSFSQPVQLSRSCNDIYQVDSINGRTGIGSATVARRGASLWAKFDRFGETHETGTQGSNDPDVRHSRPIANGLSHAGCALRQSRRVGCRGCRSQTHSGSSESRGQGAKRLPQRHRANKFQRASARCRDPGTIDSVRSLKTLIDSGREPDRRDP